MIYLLANTLCSTDPCLSSPCLNNGECLNIDRVVGSFQCECPSPFDGAVCERKQNPRAWPLEPGNCDQQIVRYYYDKMSQQCLPFKFSGEKFHFMDNLLNFCGICLRVLLKTVPLPPSSYFVTNPSTWLILKLKN